MSRFLRSITAMIALALLGAATPGWCVYVESGDNTIRLYEHFEYADEADVEQLWSVIESGGVDEGQWRFVRDRSLWWPWNQSTLLRVPIATAANYHGHLAINFRLSYLRLAQIILASDDNAVVQRSVLGVLTKKNRFQDARHIYSAPLNLQPDRHYTLYVLLESYGSAPGPMVSSAWLENLDNYFLYGRPMIQGRVGLILGALGIALVLTATMLLVEPSIRLLGALLFIVGAIGALSIREGLLFDWFTIGNDWWYVDALFFFVALRTAGVLLFISVWAGLAARRWGVALIVLGLGVNVITMLAVLFRTTAPHWFMAASLIVTLFIFPVCLYFALQRALRGAVSDIVFCAIWGLYFIVGGYRLLFPLIPDPDYDPTLWSDLLLIATAMWIYVSLMYDVVIARKILVKETASNEARMDFIARLSHEIRTPLNAIIGMTDVLNLAKLNDRQRNALGVIAAAGNNLLTLINNILDFAKFESGEFRLHQERFRLDEAAFDVSMMFFRRLAERDLHGFIIVEPDVPLCVIGDEARLKQVLLNVLDNALVHTDQGDVFSYIRRGDALPDGRVELTVSVADSGPGISPEKFEILFETFTQAGTRIAAKRGVGLGLAICKQLVECNGGRIDVDTRLGQGTTVHFTWPIKVDDDAEQLLLQQWRCLAGKKLLLVTPNDIIAATITHFLQFVGLLVRREFDLTAALHGLEQNTSDVVVVDSDNLGACRQDQFHPLLAIGIPLIYSTAQMAPSWVASEPLLHLHAVPAPMANLLDLLASIFDRTKRAAASQSFSGAASSPRQSVLVVDDNPVNLLVATQLLVSLGATVTTVQSGADAIDNCRDHRYDLILMDCEMPLMNGFQTSAAIREQERNSAKSPTPIYALTAHPAEEIKDRCAQHEMQGVLNKPITRDRLRDLLESVGREAQVGASG